MTITGDIIDGLTKVGIRLSVRGDELVVNGSRKELTPAIVVRLRQCKKLLLAALAPKPSGCAWREDEQGRLIFSDGAVYAPTKSGGWVLVQHPTRRMIAPGTFAVDGEASR